MRFRAVPFLLAALAASAGAQTRGPWANFDRFMASMGFVRSSHPYHEFRWRQASDYVFDGDYFRGDLEIRVGGLRPHDGDPMAAEAGWWRSDQLGRIKFDIPALTRQGLAADWVGTQSNLHASLIRNGQVFHVWATEHRYKKVTTDKAARDAFTRTVLAVRSRL